MPMTFSCMLAPCLTVIVTVKTVKIGGMAVKKAGAPTFSKCVLVIEISDDYDDNAYIVDDIVGNNLQYTTVNMVGRQFKCHFLLLFFYGFRFQIRSRFV